VDMWALGVMIYLMLYGKYPFEGPDHKAIVQQILKNEPDYNRGQVKPSSLAIDFMKKLLVKNPDTRLGPEQALSHPWISPVSSPDNRQYLVAGEVVRSAHRKASTERLYRAEEIEMLQVDIERRLSELERKHTQGLSTGGKKLSSGSIEHLEGDEIPANKSPPKQRDAHEMNPAPSSDVLKHSSGTNKDMSSASRTTSRSPVRRGTGRRML